MFAGGALGRTRYQLESARSHRVFDALLRLCAPDGTCGAFILEAKNRLEPREVQGIADQLGMYGRLPDGEETVPVLVAPFLSSRTRERLEELGVGYVDLTGNVRVAADRDVDWRDLLLRWTEDYSLFGSNRTATFLEPRGINYLLRKLQDSDLRYAATGSLGPASVAPVAPARLAVLFVDDAEDAADLLTSPGRGPGEAEELMDWMEENEDAWRERVF